MRKVYQEDIDKYFQPEFYDMLIPIKLGTEKGYDNDNDGWLQPTCATMAHEANTASMQRHLSEHSVGRTVVHDAPVHPLLCVAARALMAYVRYQRGIIHPEDIK